SCILLTAQTVNGFRAWLILRPPFWQLYPPCLEKILHPIEAGFPVDIEEVIPVCLKRLERNVLADGAPGKKIIECLFPCPCMNRSRVGYHTVKIKNDRIEAVAVHPKLNPFFH